MPISSTDVANILQGQVGMFAASAQYAQAVSAQYGFQPDSGAQIQDPRNAMQAGMLASGAARATEFGVGALSQAAMFGYAPRMLDPFTGTFNAASRAYGAAGMAGAIGTGAAVGGAYLALGSIYQWGVNQVVAGAQQQALLNNQMGQMAPNLSTGQLGQMSGMVSNLSRQGIGSINEITSLMQQGAAEGSIQTQSLSQFQQSFQKLLGNVRQVAATLNSTITEAQQAMAQVRAMGVSSDQAAGFLGSMRSLGQAGGLSPQQMMAAAQQGSQFGLQTGIGRQTGALGQMVQYSALGMVERGGLIEGVGLDSQGRMASGAMNFLGSRYGRNVLAAMMGPNGSFNQDVAQQLASGVLTRQDINQMASRNLAGRGALDQFNASRTELMGRFISEYGPQAIMPALNAVAGASGMPESMRSGMTGLTRQDLLGMERLNQAMPGLRNRIMQEGREGFARGTGDIGLGQALEGSLNAMVAPLRERLQEYGAQLTQSAQQVIEDVTRQFVARPPKRADPSTYAAYFRASLAGGPNPISRQIAAGMGGIQDQSSFVRPVPGGMLSDSLPSGLSLGRLGQGVGLNELPGYGLMPDSYNRFAGAAALSNFPVFGGRSAVGALGAGIDSFGAGLMRAFATESTGFMGLGGVGTAEGIGLLGGVGARGVGLGLRAAGAGLSAAAVPILAGTMALNEFPEIQRQTGFRGISQGAIRGDAARFLEYAGATGVLGENLLPQKVGGWVGGMDYEEMVKRGLTPVGTELNNGMQNFASQQMLSRADEFIRNSGALNAQFSRQFGNTGAETLRYAAASGGTAQQQTNLIANRLGISVQDARKYLAAQQASRLNEHELVGYDPVQARKEFLARNRLAVTGTVNPRYNERQRIMNDAMDPAIAAGVIPDGTIDKLMARLEQNGIPRGSVEFNRQVADALKAVAEKTGSPSVGTATINGEDFNSFAADVGSGRMTAAAGGDFMALHNQEQAAAWVQTKKVVNPRLLAEQPNAEGGLWEAGARVGFSTERLGQYLESFNQGLTTGANPQDMRITAGEQLGVDLLHDPRMTSKNLAQLGAAGMRGGTEAERRMGMYAMQDARLKGLQEQKKKSGDIAAGIIGIRFSDTASRLARQHYYGGSDLQQAYYPTLEAEMRSGIRQLYLSGGQQINEDELTSMTRELDAAGLDYAKGNKGAFDKINARIATMRNTAPSGGGAQDGDITKQTNELVSNIQAVNGAFAAMTRNPFISMFIGPSGPPAEAH